MMMMSAAPSSSFHDYLAMDSSLPKMEAMTPIQSTDEHYVDPNSNLNNSNRNKIIKRPMNAFLLWARGERKRVSSDGYGVSQTSLSKLLGETWRHMSVEEKQPFLDMAETLKRQHHLDHPDYKFKPKQRSTMTNKSINKKNSSLTCEQSTSANTNITPHPVQSNVLSMCQAMMPSTENDNDWFYELTEQPQSVIVAPMPKTQTSPTLSSRRAVRIQIINKHDDIALPPPTLLPMTPPPPHSSSSSTSSSSLVTDESTTPTLVDYLVNNCNIFHIPTTNYNNNNSHQVLAPVIDDQNEYEILQNSSINHLTDLDQHYDSSGWIDTPLSNFGTNSTDMVSSSPYPSYDFLCL